MNIPPGVAHGGAGTTYNHWGCRCDECRAANTARNVRRRKERRQELAAGQADPVHGSCSTYRNWGCRCPECRAANNAACADYKRRRKAAG